MNAVELNTTSYWIDTAKLPKFSAPKEKLQVDAIVVGGGITGITAAYLLKKAGKSVALIERERLAMIDTGHTTAHLTAVTDIGLRELRKKFGDEGAKLVWDAGSAAIDQIVKNIRAEDIACDFAWVPGFLHVPTNGDGKKDAEDLRLEAEAAKQLGIRAEFLERVPGMKVPGVHFRHQALFHPRKYLAGLLQAIPGDGSYVFENSTVEEIGEDPISAKVGNITIEGRYIVLATHNPLMGNTGMASALLFQTKLALYTSYALGARIPTGAFPPGLYWDTNDPYYYLRVEKRDGFDYAIYGGEDHKTGQEDDTTKPNAQLERAFHGVIPEAEIDYRWSGQVITTNDGLPYIGETAHRQFAATGYAGNGMTFGTLAAMMAVDAMSAKKNPWTELFDPNRKKVFGGTWNIVRENKDYPYYMVRDHLAAADGKSLEQVAAGEGKIISLDGKKVAAYRSPEGKLSLCSPICTHLQCVVNWNNAEKTWDCPCHGSRFKPEGDVISGPAEEALEKIPAPDGDK